MAILKYIETLTLQMEPQDFVNSSETRLAVSRIITWTTEPKSSDVRKVGESVLFVKPMFTIYNLLILTKQARLAINRINTIGYSENS